MAVNAPLPFESLLLRLHNIEDAVGRTKVRAAPGYRGLFFERNGVVLTILAGQPEFDAVVNDPCFREAAKGLNCQRVDPGPPAIGFARDADAKSQKFGPRNEPYSAGDRGYFSGRGQGPDGYGTLGWFFFLGDRLVGISNYHVYCHAGGGECSGVYAEATANPQAPKLGSVLSCETYDPAGALYDLALIEVDPATRLSGTFREPGFAYPMRLGTSQDIKTDNTPYTIIGAATDTFTRTFAGVGSYKNYLDMLLVEQLYFTPGGHGGDSGAVVSIAGSVVGLYHAHISVGGLSYSIANPLYRKPWTNQKPKATDYGVELPCLSIA